MNRKKLLVFGKVAKDYIITGCPVIDFKERIKPLETNRVGDIFEHWGGSGFNVAVSSSHPAFSVETHLFTQTGDDNDGATRELSSLCDRWGIKLNKLEEKFIPKICVLVDDQKDRTFLGGPNGQMEIDISNLAPELKNHIIAEASDAFAVILAGLTPHNPFSFLDMTLLLKKMKAKNQDLIIAIDLIASDFGERQQSVFGVADWLLPADAELPLLVDDTTIKDKLREELSKKVEIQDLNVLHNAAKNVFKRFAQLKLLGIKRGKAGALIYRKLSDSGNLKCWLENSISEDAKVKDTTGAGDSWIGAFLAVAASEGSNFNPSHAAKHANVMAYLCIKEFGAVTWRDSRIDIAKIEELVAMVPGRQFNVQ